MYAHTVEPRDRLLVENVRDCAELPVPIAEQQQYVIGEARGELPKRTRTNITTSQRKPWKDLEPIPAGLFGPVRLVPRSEP